MKSRSRTKRCDGKTQRVPKRIKMGTEFSGMNMASLALTNMGVKHDVLFDNDNAPACRRFCEKIIKSRCVLKDIAMRDAASLPYVHWYHYSPSCVAFSPDGKRDGDSCETGSLWTYAVDYIEKKRPMLITYEMTKSILDNKYRHVLKTMLGRLRHEGYKLHIKLMRTHDHGIPQRRVRLWVVGCRHWRYEFKWPAKVPLKKTASMIIKKKKSDDPCRLPSKLDRSISGRRRRWLVKRSYNALLAQGIDPRRALTFTDIGCSKNRGRAGVVELLPTMTATRAAQRDWWVSTRGGRIKLQELCEFQGLDGSKAKQWCADARVSRRQLGHMLGNALSCNVAERVMRVALYCAGLVAHMPVDNWAPPSTD